MSTRVTCLGVELEGTLGVEWRGPVRGWNVVVQRDTEIPARWYAYAWLVYADERTFLRIRHTPQDAADAVGEALDRATQRLVGDVRHGGGW